MILQEGLSKLNYDGKKGEDYIEAQVGRPYKSNLISWRRSLKITITAS